MRFNSFTVKLTAVFLLIVLFLARIIVFADTSTVVTVGSPGPDITVQSPTNSSNQAITGITINVVSETTISTTDVTIGNGTTAGYQDFSCTQTTSSEVNCAITIISSGNLVIHAVDSTGSTNATSSYTISTSSNSSSTSTNSESSDSTTSSASSSEASTDSSQSASTSSTISGGSHSTSSTGTGSPSRPVTLDEAEIAKQKVVLAVLLGGFTLSVSPIVVIGVQRLELLKLFAKLRKR